MSSCNPRPRSLGGNVATSWTRRVQRAALPDGGCTLGCDQVSVVSLDRPRRGGRSRRAASARIGSEWPRLYPMPRERTGIKPLSRVSDRQACAKSAGSGASNASGSPAQRDARTPAASACSAWRCMPSAGAPAVQRVADQRVAARRQVDADLVRAAGVQRAAQRAAAVVACRGSSTSVRAGLPRGDHRHAHARCCGSRPIGASMLQRRPPAPRRGPAPGTRAAPRARRSRAPAPSSRRSVLPTTIRPQVSLSSRCTMPARGSAPRRGSRASRPLSKRARPVARPPDAPPGRPACRCTSRCSSS